MPSILDQAGLSVIDCRPYALGRIEPISAAEFFERARRVAAIASAQGNLSRSTVHADCLAAIDRAAAEATGRVGYGGHVVPVFVSIGEKR